MKYIYIGGFPPPYGGVTVKNRLLFSKLSTHIEIEQSKFYDRRKRKLSRMLFLIVELITHRSGFIIGISKESLKKITYLLFYINRRAMNQSIVMVMGGTFPQMVERDPKLQKFLKQFKHIYVETNGMKGTLNHANIMSVSVFPNCREKAELNLLIVKSENPLRCLFFSQISKDKGVDIILDTVKILEKQKLDYIIDFYGHIDQRYKAQFDQGISTTGRLKYNGVFKSTTKDDVYVLLSQYDVLLFPTKWRNEGVPGVLVEAKIAGLPAIVSDINFNSEIVNDGMTGIVLKENTPDNLAAAIERIYLNRDWLIEMKKDTVASSEDYIIDNYIEGIIETLTTFDEDRI